MIELSVSSLILLVVGVLQVGFLLGMWVKAVFSAQSGETVKPTQPVFEWRTEKTTYYTKPVTPEELLDEEDEWPKTK